MKVKIKCEDLKDIEMMLFKIEYLEPTKIEITIKKTNEKYLYETTEVKGKLLLQTK